jgi:CRP-like cAMP-binding protein
MNYIWSNIFKKNNENENSTLVLLRRVPLFSQLKDRELREFQRISHIRTYSPEETIFYEGEPGVGMYIIQTGVVKITKSSEGEHGDTLLAELSDGDFFGELALLDDSPRSANAIATKDTTVIGIFRPDLLTLFHKKPKLGNVILVKLADMIGARLKATNEELNKLQEQINSGK